MSLHAKLTLFICFFLLWNNGFSQIFGGNPPSTKWRQINTPACRVIFPAGLDSTARRITNVINFIKEPTEKTIGSKSKKINIVLQNHTTISNGYVSLGPYKSEFYLTPTQNSFELGSLAWPDQLTIHEYRHVEQYNNFDVGLSRIFHLLFGQRGQALANNAAIPDWFYEGDAVYNETEISRQGRGSLPFFYKGYRALWKAGKNYRWMKLRNGSYKDFVPNHYELGYLLVAYGREKYGEGFWKSVTRDAASFKGLFYPFQRAVKKYSGLDYASFRDSALDIFKHQLSVEPVTETTAGSYLNEEYPSFTGDAMVYIKSGYSQIPEFVIKKGDQEHRLRMRDISLDDYFSLANGKIVYASYRPDIRWGYRDFSNLQVLNITTGKQRKLTTRSKYFSPSLSKDGQRVVAVDQSVVGDATLHILDVNSGKLIQTIPNPKKLFYTYPKFLDDDKIISAVRDVTGKMYLASIDIQSGSVEYLVSFVYNVIGFPSIQNDTIFFSGSYKKKDELFAYTLADKKLWQISYNDEFGLGKYQAALSDSFIAWTTFTAAGYKIVRTEKSGVIFNEITPYLPGKQTRGLGITANDNNSGLLEAIPRDSFAISRYPKSFKLINFHSIQPTIDDPEYSVTLVSENILNTMQSQFSFTYDRAEQFKKIGFQTVYGGFFPFLSAGINYTIDRRRLTNSQRAVYFDEFEPYAGFSIPLNLSNGRTFTFLNFGSRYVYNESGYKGAYKDTLGNVSFSYLNNFLSFSNQIQQARLQVFPRFAQSLNLSYKTALTHYDGFQFLANGNIYLPGLANTHSIVLNGAFLAKDTTRQVSFSSGFPFSRGYQAVNFHNMYKWGLNYHLPLFYPDAGFANIFYLLRIRANLFYDYTHASDFLNNGNFYRSQFQSTGTEINFDTKWWNQANVSIGVRYSYLLNSDLFNTKGSHRWEIILPVNIFNQ